MGCTNGQGVDLSSKHPSSKLLRDHYSEFCFVHLSDLVHYLQQDHRYDFLIFYELNPH